MYYPYILRLVLANLMLCCVEPVMGLQQVTDLSLPTGAAAAPVGSLNARVFEMEKKLD